jgi:hypothetical protein
MKKLRIACSAVSIVAAAKLLAACGGSQPPIGAPGTMPLSRVIPAHANRGGLLRAKAIGTLYVNSGVSRSNAVVLLRNGTWKEIGTITDGIGNPIRNWIDAKGNLYVADTGQVAITEYAPGASSPSFSYNEGVEEPVDVATDSAGNVYEADQLSEFVNEYPQENNTIVASCAINNSIVEAVAVDGKSDVFVAYNENKPYGQGRIVEYTGGLTGCHATLLGVTFTFVGSIALDNVNHLIVCDDSNADRVDIVKPPYQKISGTLGSGYSMPFTVRINKRNDRAYVTDEGLEEVFILKYPTGKPIAVLGSNEGLSTPSSAVDSKNFRP